MFGKKLKEWRTFSRKHPVEAAFVFAMVCVAVLWGGTKPDTPPPSVEVEGIRITKHEATPTGIVVEWETEDPRITTETEFVVEFRKRPIMLGDTVVATPDELNWQELGRTKDRELAKDIFLLDSSYEMRVRADVTETTEVTE